MFDENEQMLAAPPAGAPGDGTEMSEGVQEADASRDLLMWSSMDLPGMERVDDEGLDAL